MLRDRNIGRGRVAILAMLLAAGTAGSLAAQQVELVSRVDPGQISDTGTGTSSSGAGGAFNVLFPGTPSISDDGRYLVFVSSAPNLVQGQQEGAGAGSDVFLRDLLTGTTVLVSHSLSSPLMAANASSSEAVISGDGRYVAFISAATDLAPGQSPFLNTDGDVFLYDRVTDTTTVVASHLFATFQSLAINADGRYIAFASNAHDLVPGQQGFGHNVFLYDRTEKLLRLVSHTAASSLTGGDGFSRTPPSISADGRYVAFINTSSDLVAGQPDGEKLFLFDRDSGLVTAVGPAIEAMLSADGRYIAARSFQHTYLYERGTRITTRLSFPNPENPYDPPSIAISDDGRFVALVSTPSRLIPAQPGSGPQGMYLYDRISGSFTLASRRHGSPTESGSFTAAPTISGDGRFVAFLSRDPDMVTGQADSNGSWDLFLFDRSSGKTTLVSHAASSTTAAGDDRSYSPAISANGTRIVFDSSARDLVAGVADRNDSQDVFAFETASGSTDVVSRRAPGMPSLSSNFASRAQALSADGQWVAFESESPYLVTGQADSNGTTDIFLYDRATRSTILVSRSGGSPDRTAAGTSAYPAISADGRWVVFASNARDLAPGTPQNDSTYDFFLFDRLARTTVLIHRTQLIEFNSNGALQARISPDGRWVTFAASGNVFLWDRTTGSTLLVGHSAYRPRLSDDGRYIAFVSESTNLVPGQIDTNGEPDLFLYDRTTGRTALVSHTRSSAVTAVGLSPFDDPQNTFSMSGDGRFVAFLGKDERVEPGATYSVYLYDRTLGTNQRIASGGRPAISGDGRYVAFFSILELVPGVNPVNKSQIYLYDRITKTISLVTRSILQNSGANGETASLAINADGRYVAFESEATDLVPGQPSPNPNPFARGEVRINIFLFDRVAGTTALISHPLSATPFGRSQSPLLSASGQQVAFTSTSQLVAEDLNAHSDAYVFGPAATPSGPGPVPLPPCKLLDTRRRAERPVLSSNTARVVPVLGRCGVPATAKQVSVNVTVFNPSGKGNLRFYPGAVTATPSSTLRFERNATRTESFTLPLGTNGALTILPFVAGKGTVHAAVEVNGYLE